MVKALPHGPIGASTLGSERTTRDMAKALIQITMESSASVNLRTEYTGKGSIILVQAEYKQVGQTVMGVKAVSQLQGNWQ